MRKEYNLKYKSSGFHMSVRYMMGLIFTLKSNELALQMKLIIDKIMQTNIKYIKRESTSIMLTHSEHLALAKEASPKVV